MHNRTRPHSNALAVGLLAGCLALCACGGDQPAPDFAPPDYSYLPKMRLSVGTLTIEDHSAQSMGPNDLAPTAPVPPDQALQQMAHDRLVAAGNAGSAVFTIDQASITGSPGAALDGHMAVHLDIIAGNGAHAGYAEAHVSHQFIPGSNSADKGNRAALYSLTQQMMQDMNVELEYQVKRSLRDWLVDAAGEPVANSVEQQTLAPPGTTPPGSSTGTPVGTTPLGATPLTSPGGAPGAPPSALPPATAPSASLPSSSPMNLAPPPLPTAAVPNAASPSPAVPPTASEAPATVPAAPDAVFPDGAPPATDQAGSPGAGSAGAAPGQPEAAPLRSPPPHFLQPPPGAAPAPEPTGGNN